MLNWAMVLIVGMYSLGQTSASEHEVWAQQSVFSSAKKSPSEHHSPPDKNDDDLVKNLYELPEDVVSFLVGAEGSTTLTALKNSAGLTSQPLFFSESEKLEAFMAQKRPSGQTIAAVVSAKLTHIVVLPSSPQNQSADKK